jgi:hypothetical protein
LSVAPSHFAVGVSDLFHSSKRLAMEALVEISQLVKRYGDFSAGDSLTLSIPHGCICLVLATGAEMRQSLAQPSSAA